MEPLPQLESCLRLAFHAGDERHPSGVSLASWFVREVLPHAPDAWIDDARTRIGCEIPFTRIFHQPQPLRPLAQIDEEIKTLDSEIRCLLERLRP